MSKETINLPVVRYRDSDGKPTCKTNEGVCQFVEGPFYHKYSCFWDKPRFAASGIEIRNDGLGSLIPVDKCPLWEGVER
jgi:hypothetical protein